MFILMELRVVIKSIDFSVKKIWILELILIVINYEILSNFFYFYKF